MNGWEANRHLNLSGIKSKDKYKYLGITLTAGLKTTKAAIEQMASVRS